MGITMCLACKREEATTLLDPPDFAFGVRAGASIVVFHCMVFRTCDRVARRPGKLASLMSVRREYRIWQSLGMCSNQNQMRTNADVGDDMCADGPVVR